MKGPMAGCCNNIEIIKRVISSFPLTRLWTVLHYAAVWLSCPPPASPAFALFVYVGNACAHLDKPTPVPWAAAACEVALTCS